jgi:hypothetical protein
VKQTSSDGLDETGFRPLSCKRGGLKIGQPPGHCIFRAASHFEEDDYVS